MLATSSAFVMSPLINSFHGALSMAQVDLIPEPEGGQELIPTNTMDGTRMKLMGEADGLTSNDGTVYKFWMRTVAQGELIQKFKIDILKESKKKVRKMISIFFEGSGLNRALIRGWCFVALNSHHVMTLIG
jgi:hypothetical protein